ncbi:hypothetical protein [uncultured Microbacterium sp.]|uniref:hypothetical protein n=1 Tax=uncultured Microbacterium sp. TaxID=191216 RepID=UPI0026276C1C|nr:hypothetical protein [uncultured Microbacterium sp.]
MSYDDDAEARAARLRAKLEPDAIRSTLAFAGLYQLVHEMIKSSVLDDLKGFYGQDPLEKGVWLWGDESYRAEVLALAPKNEFRASLLWLEGAGALTSEQIERLDGIYGHRHELAHELVRFIIDADRDVDVLLLTDALAILRDIRVSGHRWKSIWARSIVMGPPLSMGFSQAAGWCSTFASMHTSGSGRTPERDPLRAVPREGASAYR